MKNKKYRTVGTVSKSIRKKKGKQAELVPINIYMHDLSLC